MSRNTGPRRKIVRRLGVVLDGLTRHVPGDRAYPPGQHGPSRKRREPSEYAVRLKEKQKLRHYYGVTETQLRKYVTRAARQPGPTGQNLFALLERRLDNVVFRLGLAPTARLSPSPITSSGRSTGWAAASPAIRCGRTCQSI